MAKPIYKVTFHNQGKVYEIFARSVHQSSMMGFIEIDKLLFGEKTTVVLDPSEEHLKTEFKGVMRTFLPIHSIIRIDEVEKQGHGKITAMAGAASNIAPFPVFTQGDGKKS